MPTARSLETIVEGYRGIKLERLREDAEEIRNGRGGSLGEDPEQVLDLILQVRRVRHRVRDLIPQ